MSRYAILGAGISGLHLAYQLQKKVPPSEIVLFEKSDRVGGWIQTVEKEGFVFECGPRSLRSQSPLIAELELSDQIIFARPSSKRRFLLQNGQLKELILWRSSNFWRGVLRDLFAKKGQGDETVGSFAARRFGEAFANAYFDPLIKGIFAGDMDKLSLKWAFPKFVEAEKKYRSVSLGSFFLREKSSPIYSFKGGLKTLTSALFNRLKVEVRFNETLKNLSEFTHIFSTIPSYALYDLLGDEALLQLPFQSVSTVSFGFRKLLSLEGFGYLVPSSEKSPLLGCVFDSSVFPRGQTVLSFMISGVDWSDGELISLARGALSRHLKVELTPAASHIFRAARAIPQYPVGYDSVVQGLKSRWPNVTFLGSSFAGVSVNDQIRLSKSVSC